MDFDEDPDYLDIDVMLAQTQTVNCQFLMSIPGLEFLSSSGESVVEGTELMLPFWLAKPLYAHGMIDVTVPDGYKESFRDKLEADPTLLDLHKAGPNYYKFGKMLVGLKREKGNNLPKFNEDGQLNKYRREEAETLEDRRAIAESLMKTFHARRHLVLEYSFNYAALVANGHFQSVNSFVARLDETEKRLYLSGRQQIDLFNKWRDNVVDKVSKDSQKSKKQRLEQ